YSSTLYRGLHSFPTRRSSDLELVLGILEHVGDAPGRADVPRDRGQCAREHEAEGGLPRSVRADDRDELAASHGDGRLRERRTGRDRKSTRLNSSHRTISYAVF